jgi:ribonucleoside-diphosphate reductase beta chain
MDADRSGAGQPAPSRTADRSGAGQPAPSRTADRRRAALQRISADDPELAARLILMTLPAAASRIDGTLAFDLEVDGLGTRRVAVADGRARVQEPAGPADVDFRLQTDPGSLVELVTGSSGPLGLMLRGRVRIRGKRRRALRLAQMASAGGDLADVVGSGGTLDPDVLYRALPYLVEPQWTVGHAFTVRYQVTGDGGGDWYVHVRDGERLEVTRDAPDDRDVAGTARFSFDAYQLMAAGELSPSHAMQTQLTVIEGQIPPITLLGRWIERSQGRDDAELQREREQRELQQRRAGLFARDGAGPGQGDPGHEAEAAGLRGDPSGATPRRDGRDLLDYRQLYVLWERQNWKAHELDFTADKEQWVVTPREGQENLIWSLGSFYVGEERVTADLAPFLGAAPSGEIELFLATQLVDEARHAAFFDRFGAEVMCLSAEDFRGRMREVEAMLLSPWREVFDDGLRDVADRIRAKPDDLDLFVEGIATYHMVVEGFLAVTGQTLIRDYMLEHSLYPGFCEGFGLVERDERRHLAFGVRFLRDAIEDDPRHRHTVERVVMELAPRAAYVFAPPYADDPRDYVSYGYSSRQIYGFAYRTLKRRMQVLGIEIPPPAELMPGPIEDAEPVAAPADPGNGAPRERSAEHAAAGPESHTGQE